MKKEPKGAKNRIVIAKDEKNVLTCTSEGFEYTPDIVKNVYGKSSRPALEDWFLTELDFFRRYYPGYEVFTLGSSCVFGEKFVNYLTICEFDIDSTYAFDCLKKALRESDQAIRRKLSAMWKWDIAARKDWSIVFMVGHMDFAYFLQHRKEFQGDAHKRFMSTFTTAETKITSRDYKVMHDGAILPFDETALSPEDRFIFENYQKIKFETTPL
ncbi:TPA: hypothetical protein NHQ65_005398 [Pseudomonas aeruginosa]|jgi:hypothetical protein|nr:MULTISPECIES: hypothetical protein [Pseudomonas]SCY24718.1 Uncharacterised protein [Acinetobacter baumannii]HCL2792925.1 hypothetical protein [Pseudomonas aeruginosa 7D9A]ALU51677.1 hypothetical protein AU380_28825 [Pseudomonas aeruginosa]ASJ86886.1 hypothetical protein PSA83_04709 [Pseudomonas aeruginosa]AUA85074.1 hypothetical protein CWI22_22655 [Pseudomonas aeruginosa]